MALPINCAALNDQNKEESENNNSLQSMFLPGAEEFRKENGFVQGFNFGDQNNNSHICEERKNLSYLHLHLEYVLFMHFILGLLNIIILVLAFLWWKIIKSATANHYCADLNDENKKDCEDKNSPQLMSLCGSEDFRNENGFVQDFNVCDKNDISDTYEERKNLHVFFSICNLVYVLHSWFDAFYLSFCLVEVLNRATAYFLPFSFEWWEQKRQWGQQYTSNGASSWLWRL